MIFSFAKFIGNICDKVGANSSNITKALGYDKRISPYYIKSGLSFGGTCFPRDTHAFAKFSSQLGLTAVHIIATDEINRMQDDILYAKLENFIGKTIGVIGLSFKPDSVVMVESPSIKVINKLVENGQESIIYYDELITKDMVSHEYPWLKNVLLKIDSLEKIYDAADVILLAHPSPKHILDTDKKLIDPWNLTKKR
jgi:UDPglucose 6-dehydrogenase